MGRKLTTSFTLEAETARIIAERASEIGIDASAYIDRVIQRADFLRRVDADADALRAAGLEGDSRDRLMATLIHQQRSLA